MNSRVRELPTTQDDRRLQAWYHTVELGNGLCSQGTLELRETVDLHLPPSLERRLRAYRTARAGTAYWYCGQRLHRRGRLYGVSGNPQAPGLAMADAVAAPFPFPMAPWMGPQSMKRIPPSGCLRRAACKVRLH